MGGSSNNTSTSGLDNNTNTNDNSNNGAIEMASPGRPESPIHTRSMPLPMSPTASPDRVFRTTFGSTTNRLKKMTRNSSSTGNLQGMVVPHVQPQAILAWTNLTVSVKSMNKVLLHNVQGKISNGFYAIMGPSGSGKSTLLNTLARRLDRNMKIVSGEIKLNGRDYSHSELKWMSGYVMQDDMLNGDLTVHETLTFTAELRMPPTVSAEERVKRVEMVMEDMGLSRCRDVVIGTPLKKGISGGERKRVCVAMELLTQPVLLFLDEPTSGLDSVTALSLCRKLKQIADSGTCSVVCTIHQPQAKIFRLFDTLLLLKSGTIIYSGRAADAASFFAQAGYPVPSRENPANHFMDVITPNMSESVEDLQAKEIKLKEHHQPAPVDLKEGVERPQFLQREVTPWWKQFMVLFLRTMQQQWRRMDIIAAQVLQTVIMAVLIGTAFLFIGTGQSSVSLRKASLFFCVVNQGVFGAMTVINSFPSERLLVLRERAAGTYYVSAYYAAKCWAEAVWQLPPPVIFACIVYWLVGYQPVAGKFFIFMAFMVLTSFASCSLALAVSALARTTDMSVAILPLVLEVSRLFAGYYLSPATVPGYFVWLDAMSYIYYAYIGISLNEYDGLVLTGCSPGNPTCISSGQQTIDQLGLDTLTIGKCVGILISYITICRLVAYAGIRWIKW